MSQSNNFRWIGQRPIRPDGADKVTGRAQFAADFSLPDQLHGAVLRSPHAHARIRGINAERAQAMPGVAAVITAADFPEIPPEQAVIGGQPPNFRHLSANLMARDKVLYDGHAVAAVAAVDAETARRALSAIEVDYEVLPHVIDVCEAMAPAAPVLHEDLFTQGVTPAPTQASNIASRHVQSFGDVDAGMAQAEVVVEAEFTTAPVHQAYIELHACTARVGADGQTEVWCSSQGQFMVRAYCARLLNLDLAHIRVIPLEIGGGFGGKTTIYLEPLAILLSRKSGRPVFMQMSRDEVFRATGPASGSHIRLKLGARRDGRILAVEGELNYQAGAFPGAPARLGCMVAFAPYDIPHSRLVGHDVVCNRPKSAAYRAPGGPMAAFAAESLLDMLAQELAMDPLQLREINAVTEGSQAAYGPRFGVIGFRETLQAARLHQHLQQALGPNQGRGIASGFWFNIGGQSSARVSINEDGSAIITTANPDIGGSRAAMCMMAAEVLGIDLQQVQIVIADTSASAYSDLTGGSRVTFAIGMAVTEAARSVVDMLRARAALLWDLEVEQVSWSEGAAHAVLGEQDARLSLAELAAQSAGTGGPISAQSTINARGAGPGFGTHICDVEVDPDTGQVTILRYTAIQDVGRAIHPSYVEGQLQGGVAQGIGWALNEAYVHDEHGRLLNPGLLDYRVPVASDLPMIDTVLVEVPNPKHPFGVRGVGEVPIVPPLAAVANAVARATGKRYCDLPLNPQRIVGL